MTKNIEVLHHSSIRITAGKTIYFDPFKIAGETHDADIIFVTHEHSDHFSPEDIGKIIRQDTVLVLPEVMREKAWSVDVRPENIIAVKPGEETEICGIPVKAVPAYNNLKHYHPKENKWVGYIVTIDGRRIYVAGDTDLTEDNRRVSCDIALVPIGGKFTMNAEEAAELVNTIKPETAIPTHYGSVAGVKEDEEVFKSKVDEGITVLIKMQRY